LLLAFLAQDFRLLETRTLTGMRAKIFATHLALVGFGSTQNCILLLKGPTTGVCINRKDNERHETM
jgi:hypothetical protein